MDTWYLDYFILDRRKQNYGTADRKTQTTKNSDQWDRIESLEINSYIYRQLVIGKGVQNLKCKKECLFKNGTVKTG